MMQISKQVLSIPPYLSVAWSEVSALRVEEGAEGAMTLIVGLKSGSEVRVPHLDSVAIGQVFSAHRTALESSEKPPEGPVNPLASMMGPLAGPMMGGNPQMIGLPIRFGPGGIEGIDSALQHDPAQANMPDLPPEILEKIGGIAAVLGVENSDVLPKAETGCNCLHCQIARAIHADGEEEQILEEEVSDEELRFRDWDISQTDDKLYMVANPLDMAEKYSVFLGDPIGCTCGQKNCDHVKAVLQS